jgi:hypothetical protein
MTIRELLVSELKSNGMFPDQAEAVMTRIIEQNDIPYLISRLDDDSSGYQPALLSGLWYTVKRHALAWINANCPEAWYKPMFEDDSKENT